MQRLKKRLKKRLTKRRVYFGGQQYDTPIYRRDELGPDTHIDGPAIVEQLDSTTLVWPKQDLKVDSYGQLLLGPLSERKE